MKLIEKIHDLREHAFWANSRLLDALRPCADMVPEALQEFAHIIGAEENWLARIENRPCRSEIWPDLSFSDVQALTERTQSAYKIYVASLKEDDLTSTVTYQNSKGQHFTNTVGDILLHVALHGQYHRGRVNLLLRLSSQDPAPADYIAFVRTGGFDTNS